MPSTDALSAAAWPCLRARNTGSLLNVAVVPNARRTCADGLYDGALRIRLAARPIDGAANEALVSWLAGELGIAKRDIRVEHGLSSRRKRVALDLAASRVASWLSRVAGPAGPGHFAQ